MKTYRINEIFYSIQGEGVRAGTPNVFLRFSGCNLQCSQDNEAGFDCDTEFSSGVDYTLNDLIKKVQETGGKCRNVIFTGGEPMLQLKPGILSAFKQAGFYLAVETNGTIDMEFARKWLDWICVSPKSAEHTIRVICADEVKYVRNEGQGIPKPSIHADHKIISPAFLPSGWIAPETLAHCIELVKQNPEWRLSVQLHKLWGVR